MHTPSSNGGPTFRIEMSLAIEESIIGLLKHAVQEGRGVEFYQAMSLVMERIRHSARSAGEPLYRLPALKMQVRLIAQLPIIVHYGVCENRDVAYIKLVTLFQ